MSRLLLILSLILLATSTHAQSSTSLEATTSDGRIVILKADGTWEFKKIAPQPSPTPATNLVKAGSEANALPTNFAGPNLEELFLQLLKLARRLDKSEFETTAEYEKRAVEEKQKPILDNLTIKDIFYLVVPGIEAEYNADLQKMKFFCRFEKVRTDEVSSSTKIGKLPITFHM